MSFIITYELHFIFFFMLHLSLSLHYFNLCVLITANYGNHPLLEILILFAGLLALCNVCLNKCHTNKLHPNVLSTPFSCVGDLKLPLRFT